MLAVPAEVRIRYADVETVDEPYKQLEIGRTTLYRHFPAEWSGARR